MAQCCSSYLVPEKVLSSNPLVSRWKALSQSLVGTTSLIPIWYHKSLEFSNPGSENIIISCVTRLCWLISQSQFLFGTTKVLSFKPTHEQVKENIVVSSSTRFDLMSCPLSQGLTWGPANSLWINSASVFKKKKKNSWCSIKILFLKFEEIFTHPSIIITCRRNTWNSKCGRRRWWVKRRLQQLIFQAEEETSSDATKRRAS